ncbi:MAG: glycosyltransferase family 9 protein [Verrucomicrobiae bacterium]|nr:glycosyltransferase family 9 protein [Verrucomicrobiae bacterium]
MQAPRGPNRILVIRGGAIGDFVLTLPALAALRRHFAHARLDVLGYPHIAQLAVAGGLADRVEPIEAPGLAGFFAPNADLSQRWADYFAEFDLIVSYLFDPDKIFQRNVARCTAARFIAGPHRPDEHQSVHATQVFLRPMQQLGIGAADAVPRLHLQPASAPAPNRLALHPGSGSEKKNWPEARWAELVSRLAGETTMEFLLVGGEAERDRLDRLAARLPAQRLQVAQSRPLAELARMLQGGAGFVGHDSGISHLAAALGLPCVVLWAETPEQVWRPLGERVRIVRDPEGIQRLDVERVWKELCGLLES